MQGLTKYHPQHDYRSKELDAYFDKKKKKKCPASQSNLSPPVLMLGTRMMPKRMNLNF